MALALTAWSADTIEWQSLGNGLDADGKPHYTQRFTVTASQPFSRICFSSFRGKHKAVDQADTIVELLPGYYAVASPRFAEGGKPITIDIITPGSLTITSFRPDGFHLVDMQGQPVATENYHHPITEFPAQWHTPDGQDGMIYAEEAYRWNDSVRTSLRPGPYAQIPTPKYVETDRSKRVRRPVLVALPIQDAAEEYYRVSIDGRDTAYVYTSCTRPDVLLRQLNKRLDRETDRKGTVPQGVIEDWPDYRYRGLMIDVARNFLPKSDIMRLLDLMGDYGLNVLHFHLGDDEGWRLEIPTLPELTQVGGRRGYATTDSVPYLKGIYSGNGNPDAGAPASGYYTVEDYIEILQHADSLGIRVMPEFDTPGHSRAAIRAMEWRADPTYILVEPGDTSRYRTAQDFTDDIMNPALEGPYRLWDTVMESVQETYRKAGVPLPAINIGGDEVPRHAWDGSQAVRKLMEREGFTDQHEVHALFVRKVAKLAHKRGLKIGGWSEIAKGNEPMSNIWMINDWGFRGPDGAELARKGWPVVITNVDHLYFDQIQTSHPEEPGLKWGGVNDEWDPLHATREKMMGTEQAIGIEAAIFGETIRGRGDVERFLLPRILGLAERAHNADKTVSDEEYFARICAEMPRWEAQRRNMHLRQPGISLQEGKVVMNSPYPFGQIRYTIDGSEPTAKSKLYKKPFRLSKSATQIRAKLFYGTASSPVSIWVAAIGKNA